MPCTGIRPARMVIIGLRGPTGESADDHAYAQIHPARKFPDLLVGEGDASIGPIDRLVNAWIAASEAVYAQLAAERRVLGGRAAMLQGLKDCVEFSLADDPLGIGATGNGFGGIIEAIERAVSALVIDPGHVKRAARRSFVSPVMHFGSASATD